MTMNPFRRLLPLIFGIVIVGAAAFYLWKATRPAPKTRNDTGKTQYWISGMHPWIVMPEPGQCPICGMDLVPLDPAKFSSEIAINPVIVQNMGVRIDPVESGPVIKTIRTVGIVDYDEQNVRDVNTKVSGWIEKLFVDSLGARVNQGDPLFSVYSPQLYSAQQDYLIARRAGNRSLLDAARTRLEYLDVTPGQIEELTTRGEPQKSLVVKSPFTGVVTEKHANEGMKIDPGMQTFRIADLSKVWVMVTVYEYQLPFLEVGQEATMSLEYIPGQTLEGKVAYIYPYLDKKTREAQVRLEFDNPGGLLKPGMFASVELRNRLAAEATLAPRSAVIDTGTRKVAFVSLGKGRFEPRDVTTGVPTGDGKIQILSGLQPGESVVTSGQFLLDSEANMREALAKMLKGDSPLPEAPSEKATPTLSDTEEKQLGAALKAYLTIQSQLAEDSMEGVADAAGQLIGTIGTLPDSPGNMMEEAQKLAVAHDLSTARLAFGQLSVPFRTLFARMGIPRGIGRPILALHCPMYFEDQGGAVWLQVAGDVRNPYMGSRMRACFDERVVLPEAGAKDQ